VKLDVNINIEDIMQESLQFEMLNDCLLFVISQVKTRIKCYQSRKLEMEKLVAAGSIYDEYLGEMLVQSEKSGRAFVLKIDPLYPMSGLKGIKVLGVEPQETDMDVSVWNQKISTSELSTLSDFVEILV
jgi:hypothetical protein